MVRFANGENSVLMEIVAPGSQETVETRITATSEFAHGRLDEVSLFGEALDEWATILDALPAGRSATWMEDGRGLQTTIVPIEFSDPSGPRTAAETTIKDLVASCSLSCWVGLQRWPFPAKSLLSANFSSGRAGPNCRRPEVRELGHHQGGWSWCFQLVRYPRRHCVTW
ncbi:DUF5959 family protein [Spirillospora sp. CA-253888]